MFPSYQNPEDENGDGIYEVNVKVTDIQTLKSSIIHLKFKLISSKIKFYNENYYYDYDYTYSVPENTAVGGEVPYTTFRILKADGVDITDLYLARRWSRGL